jgi:hypothetical protein
MSKEITEEQKKFMQETVKHQQEQVEGLAYQVLMVSLAADLPVFDLPYYILQRSRQMIEEGFKATSFQNKKLIKARKAFLKECLAAVKENLPTQTEKEGGDETTQRDNRCEPIAKKLADLLLDESLIFSDSAYFDKVLENEESVPLSAAIAGYMGALDEKLLMIISEHYRRANEKLWGVEKEKVTFKALDALLKKD